MITKSSLLFLLLGLPLLAWAQLGKTLEVRNADLLEGTERKGVKLQKLTGNVVLVQEDVTLTCDSALLNQENNEGEAFGNVKIVQGSSTITGKYARYLGNEKRALIREDVVLIDKELTLKTTQLDYDLNRKTGYYTSGANIINGNSTLESQIGIFYSESKDMYFKKNVILKSPEYTMTGDTLKYNTQTEVAYFFGPTHITGKDNRIYCENGWYDTREDRCQFSRNASITSASQILKADSMIYNRKLRRGRAFRNIHFADTLEQLDLFGGYGEYYEQEKRTLVTQSPVAYKLMDEDTLRIKADTLLAIAFDSSGTERLLRAYHQVKLYRGDLQGLCDSLSYDTRDSSIRFYKDPVLWSGQNQLTGDTILCLLNGNQLREIRLRNNGFIISEADSGRNRFNQIKGRNITGELDSNTLKRVIVKGNGQSNYYALDDSSRFVGLNHILCKDMKIFILDNKVQDVFFYTEPKGAFYPMDDIPVTEEPLRGFNWRANARPVRQDY